MNKKIEFRQKILKAKTNYNIIALQHDNFML